MIVVKKIFLLIALWLSVSPYMLMGQESPEIVNRSTTVQVVDGKEYFFHAILQGQTLFSIARAYGVTVEEILRENPDVNPDQIPVNQLIRIPVKKEQRQQPQRKQQTETLLEIAYTEHLVKRRETVYGISRKYDISEAELIEHNPEIRTGLHIGMILQIPRSRKVQVAFEEYTVPSGQTLFSISREFDVSVEELEKYNPQLKEGLKAGQLLRIPVEPQMPTQPPFAYDPEEEDMQTDEDSVIVDPYCDDPKTKSSYNVALLIPLHLENVSDGEEMSQHEREQSFRFLEYYEGIVLALDSIRALGADINLTVIDVDDSETKARSAIWNHDLASMDLIIGPFLPNVFPIVADFAHQRDIPIVSPIYSEDRSLLRKYPNMFQATPGFQTRMNDVASYIVEKYPGDNIILVHNNQQETIDLISGFKEDLNESLNRWHYKRDSINLAHLDGYFFDGVYVGERITNVYVLNDSLLDAKQSGNPDLDPRYEKYRQRDLVQEVIYTLNGIDSLKATLDTNRRNILISLIGGEPQIANYTRELNQLRDTFDLVVFGVPQWRNYRSLDSRYLMNLKVHLFDADFIDYTNSDNINFIKKYRDINHVEPDNMAFMGVRTGMYFFSALMHYGTEFHRCISFINHSKSYETPFLFQRPDDESGWENRFVYIFTYRDYRLIDVRDPKNKMITHQD